MASLTPLHSPSAGSVIKKIVELNPSLGVEDVIALVRQSIRKQGGSGNEFSDAEFIDEKLALRLARETLALKERPTSS